MERMRGGRGGENHRRGRAERQKMTRKRTLPQNWRRERERERERE